MDRNRLTLVLSKAFIRGLTDKVVLYFDADSLCCAFTSVDGIMSGNVVYTGFGDNFIGTGRIGISDTHDLIKKVDTLSETIDISFLTEGRAHNTMVLTDGLWTIKHSLISDSQLPKIRKPKADALSGNPSSLLIDTSFIRKFYKMTGSVKDSKYMYVIVDGKTAEFYISQSDDFLTGVKFKFELNEPGCLIDKLKFDLKSVRSILNVNRSAKSGSMVFYSSGLLCMHFTDGDVNSSYYVATDF